MSTVVRVRRFTHDDLERLPQEREGDRHELIDGEIFVTPSPIPPHQSLLTEFGFSLGDAVRPGNLGRIYYAPTDVKPTPDDWVVPDLCFVARERLSIVGASAINGAPDLIVEILSPSTRGRDRAQKRALYERTGVREYWLVDPTGPDRHRLRPPRGPLRRAAADRREDPLGSAARVGDRRRRALCRGRGLGRSRRRGDACPRLLDRLGTHDVRVPASLDGPSRAAILPQRKRCPAADDPATPAPLGRD